MDKRAPAVWVWSASPSLPPHQLRVYPLAFAGVFAGVFFALSIALFALLAYLPPYAIDAPLTRLAGVTFHIVAWKLSGGILWPEAAPYQLSALTAIGGMAVACKAIAAAASGALFAWFASRSQLTPRDAYQHIRGPQRYEGEEAMKKLEDQLRNK